MQQGEGCDFVAENCEQSELEERRGGRVIIRESAPVNKDLEHTLVTRKVGHVVAESRRVRGGGGGWRGG